MTEPACIQVVIIPELRQPLERWLAVHGLILARIPGGDPDDLPTYVVHPKPAPSSSVGGTTTSSDEQA